MYYSKVLYTTYTTHTHTQTHTENPCNRCIFNTDGQIAYLLAGVFQKYGNFEMNAIRGVEILLSQILFMLSITFLTFIFVSVVRIKIKLNLRETKKLKQNHFFRNIECFHTNPVKKFKIFYLQTKWRAKKISSIIQQHFCGTLIFTQIKFRMIFVINVSVLFLFSFFFFY